MIYLVHKDTKEHRRYADAIVWRDSDCRFVQADPDGWIEWQGGGCPVPAGVDVCWKGEDGEVRGPVEGVAVSWSGGSQRIIAYRPVLDAKPEAPLKDKPWWSVYQPEPPAWHGEGLPPVGCECEVSIENGTYKACKVIAYHEDMMWLDMKCAHPVRLVDRCKFRPIRSEEDRVVDEMVEAIVSHYEYPKGAEQYMGLAQTLYRAGYRKTGGE